MSIRMAIIGVGIMGSDHAKIVAEDLLGAKLQVICDKDKDKAKSVADAYDAQDISTDPEGVIIRGDVDAVIISSPDFTHAPLAKACIAAGKRVLCEKPLSDSSIECLEVMAAERNLNARCVMLGFMRRFDQSYVEMKAALDNNNVGRALMMHNFHRNVEIPTSDFSASMAISNSAPHEFDVARYVLGTEFASITAFKPHRADGRAAPVIMVLETVDDQLVTIEINNNAAYGYDVRAELVGETGSISINNQAHTRTDIKFSSSTSYDADWRGRFHDAYVRQNRKFLNFVKTGSFPEIASDCWDGYCTALVAEFGIKSLHSGAKHTIRTIPKPELYRTHKGVIA